MPHPIEPIRYVPPTEAADKAHRIDELVREARERLLADLENWHASGVARVGSIASEAGFADRPERLLADYQVDRNRADNRSRLGQVLSTARRLADEVDRVIFLGPRECVPAVQGLVEACAHPFHNELSRAERGGWPRLCFASFTSGVDALEGLADLLDHEQIATQPADRSAIVVFDPGRTGLASLSSDAAAIEAAQALARLYAPLARTEQDESQAARLFVPISTSTSWLAELSRALGCPDLLAIADGIAPRHALLTAAGLLPAALAGLDVVRLLEGAEAIGASFRDQPPGTNPVLDLAAVCQAMSKDGNPPALATSTRGLERLGPWHEQLWRPRLAGPQPASVAVEIALDHARRKPVVPAALSAHLPQPLAAICAASPVLPKTTRLSSGLRSAGTIHLPRADEGSLGQLVQLLMLSADIGQRLAEMR